MSDTYARAEEIVTLLIEAGVRATVDPSAVNPPAVLVAPPTRAYDLPCGFSAMWTLIALAPGAQGADRTTWGLLDTLADAVAEAVPVERAEMASYTINGVTLPAYVCTFTEAR